MMKLISLRSLTGMNPAISNERAQGGQERRALWAEPQASAGAFMHGGTDGIVSDGQGGAVCLAQGAQHQRACQGTGDTQSGGDGSGVLPEFGCLCLGIPGAHNGGAASGLHGHQARRGLLGRHPAQ